MKKVYTGITGKCGKSSLVNSLEFPRMPNATIIRVETINNSGLSGCNSEIFLKGRDLGQLETELVKVEDAIIDVGASNIESFLLSLNSEFESHQIFDYFIVPVIARASAQIEMSESITTLKTLAKMGIEPERIKVIFNRLPKDSSVSDECKPIIFLHRSSPIFTLNLDAFVYETEAYAALGSIDVAYIQMLSDQKNYRQELNKIPIDNQKARIEMVRWARAQGTTRMLEIELSNLYQILYG
ncbi:hypothetical protein [Sapientia aquatica]|uniref:Plasmid stability protein StbB n=1 Tax=Sapientia aquatica TaxID=1549640 RepID=A0A4R5VTH2_9BURK|nr:hypothetical protein [Sapientia aquatica]TDK61217.1 hypothetical protein E2I14_17685 [Sapientia aquatica]